MENVGSTALIVAIVVSLLKIGEYGVDRWRNRTAEQSKAFDDVNGRMVQLLTEQNSELERQRKENRQLLSDVREIRNEHQDCERRYDALHEEVRLLRDKLA